MIEDKVRSGCPQTEKTKIELARRSNDEFIDDLIDRAGGVGIFHLVFYLAISWAINCVFGFVYFQLPFYIKQQVYVCELTPGSLEDVCTIDNICEGDSRIISWKVDFDDKRSLHNFLQRLDLTCEPAWKASMLAVVFGICWSIMLLVTPKISDKFGRKWIFTITRFLDCVAFTVLVMAESYTVALISLGFLGALTPGRYNTGIPYLAEWFPKRKSSFVLSFRLVELSVYLIFSICYFWFIGNDA